MSAPLSPAGLALGAAAVLGVVAGALALRMTRSAASAFMDSQHEVANRDLADMFVFASGTRLAVLTLAFAALAGLGTALLGGGWPVVAAALMAGLYFPRAFIRQLQKRRLRRIGAQLPDALAFWAGLLQAGQGLHPALAQLAERQPGPLGDELRVVARQCRLGVPVEAAVHRMCERLGLPDLRMLATQLRISRELGGNLGESLLRLSDLLRARLAMEGRIHSLTSQGRLQGLIVGALPLALLAVLSFMEPEAMAALFTQPAGWVALGLITLLETAGFLLIRRIVAIEV